MCEDHPRLSDLRQFFMKHPAARGGPIVLHRHQHLHQPHELESDEPETCWCCPLVLTVDQVFAPASDALERDLDDFYRVH